MFSWFRRKEKDDSDDESGKKKKDDDSEEEDEEDKKPQHVRYRQWLYDRVDGIPRPSEGPYDRPDPYPPSVLCLPPVALKCCPFLLEENYFCARLGKFGCCKEEEAWARNAVMKYSIFLNLVGLGCLIYASLGMVSRPEWAINMLPYTSFASAELIPVPDNFFSDPVSIHVGLTSILLDNPNNDINTIIRFDQFCDLLSPEEAADGIPAGGLESYMQDPASENCSNCIDAQPKMIIGLLVAILCALPSIAVNCTRMYSSTDLNCQKFVGVVLEGLSLAGCILCFLQFRRRCLFATFLEDEVGYRQSGEVVDEDSVFSIVTVNYDWGVGYGMLCLVAAFGIKVIDFVCNCCIPTPAMAWNSYEQKLYEGKVEAAREAELAALGLLNSSENESGWEDEESNSSSSSTSS